MNGNQQPQTTKPPTPKCPQCKAQMPNIAWNTGAPVAGIPEGPPLALVTFFCPQCLTALNCQLIPIAHILSADRVAQIHHALASRIMRPQG